VCVCVCSFLFEFDKKKKQPKTNKNLVEKTCYPDQWALAIEKAASDAGVQLKNYQHRVFVLPKGKKKKNWNFFKENKNWNKRNK